MNKRCRNWCFTSFITDKNYDDIFNDEQSRIRYLGYGVEVCPRTQKEHHQGWCQFRASVTMRTAKKELCLPAAHLEMCKGTPEENDKYCSKVGVLHTWGSWVSSGKRVGLEDAKLSLDRGASLGEVAEAHFSEFVRYHRGFAIYQGIQIQKKAGAWRDVEVTLVSGCTGGGKSRYAYAHSKFQIKGYQMQWWDGYEGQDSITIDEYANDVKITQMLSLLDGYPLRLPIKGGFTYAAWTKVFITTNLQVVHQGAKEEHRRAFDRRITKKIYCPWKRNINTETGEIDDEEIPSQYE